MSVELEPSELAFRRPFDHEVSQVLRLSNPSQDPVAFKVKTTAPKKYCVRPNSGRIEVGKNVEVHGMFEPAGDNVEIQTTYEADQYVPVLLQALKDEPPANERCKDKFLVQTVPVPVNEEFTNVAAIYTDPDSPSPNPATFDTPSHQVPSAMRSPDSTAKPATHSAPADTSTTTSSQPTVKRSPPAEARAMPDLPDAVPTSTEELKQALAAAQAHIVSLTQQAEQGLRQRKIPEKPGQAVQQVQQAAGQAVQEGVPVQITAALCLLSFLLAYWFF
ncbi:MAG: phosphatidylinositol-binding protein scs2 [Vezdaea aestivalis]|nr:MAG: phosphatidylinositol-binding protein scs2 [Vezdaea aestivalis]